MPKNKPFNVDLVQEVKTLIKRGTKPSAIKRVIGSKLHVKKTQSLHVYNQIVQSLGKPDSSNQINDEREWATELVSEKPYYFNDKTRQYIVFLKRAARNIVVQEETHKAILEAYSGWDEDARSINDICRTFRFPRAYLEEYLKIFGITHDALPITDEDLNEKTEEEIIESLKEKRHWSILQKYNKSDWNETRKNAERWTAFQFKQLDPFESIIKSWQPPKLIQLPKRVVNNQGESIFVCGAFDWQIGNVANKRFLFNSENWSTVLAEKAIERFANKIATDIKIRTNGFDKCVLILGGDLNHGFSGFTAKGTPLEVDTLRDEQFDALFNSLLQLINVLYQVFGKVEIRAVRGNHDGFDFYPAMKGLEAYFRQDKNIIFNIYSSRTASFRIGPVFVVLDHGASDLYKAQIPNSGKKRESYIQSLLLSKPEDLIGAKQKIFICGDKHTFQQIEHNDFEYFMFGCLPLGDQYANHLGLGNRPRQNCMVIDGSGVKEVLHYYIDDLMS